MLNAEIVVVHQFTKTIEWTILHQMIIPYFPKQKPPASISTIMSDPRPAFETWPVFDTRHVFEARPVFKARTLLISTFTLRRTDGNIMCISQKQ